MQHEGDKTNRGRPAVLVSQCGKRRARCEEERDDREGVAPSAGSVPKDKARPRPRARPRQVGRTRPGILLGAELSSAARYRMPALARGPLLAPHETGGRHWRRYSGEWSLRRDDLAHSAKAPCGRRRTGHEPKRQPPDPAPWGCAGFRPAITSPPRSQPPTPAECLGVRAPARRRVRRRAAT